MGANDNNNVKGTIFSNGNPISEISSKWGESSNSGFLTHSKEGENKGNLSVKDIVNLHQNKEKNKE